jgi:DNA-binding response OmpR family regulator
MAGIDGYELVKWLRRGALEANRYLPVILVSGHTPPSQVFKARDAGANFTVAKPITPKMLLERILWAAKEERQFIECDRPIWVPTGGSRTTARRRAPRGAAATILPQALRPPGAQALESPDSEKVKP